MRNSFLVLIAVAAVVYATPATAIPGGWEPIPNVNDPHIQELGGWAVAEHVKRANDGLKFNKVVSGDQQPVSGENYRLVIVALKLDGKDGTYKAGVYEQEWTNTRELVSFVPAN